MAKIGKLFVDFEARTAKFEENTKRAGTSIRNFGKDAKATKGVVGELGNSFTRFVAPVAVATLALAGLNSAFSNVRQAQKLEAMLKTATGSAEAAAIQFTNLQSTAKKMPLGLQEVTTAFIKLKNLGLDPSEAALLSYGNTATAMGKSLNDFIEAVADAATGEFERLKEFGIKARTEGERVTFIFQGVSTTVRKNASEIEEYLRRIGDVQFAGSVADQMNTIDMKLSMLADSWFQFTTAVGNSFIGDAAGGAIGYLASILDDLTTNIQAFKIDIDKAGLKDLEVMKKYIERAERGGSVSLTNLEAVKAKIAELELLKKQKEAEEEVAATKERILDGESALRALYLKKKNEALPIEEKLKLIYKERVDIFNRLKDGAFKSAEAEIKRLEELDDMQDKLKETLKKSTEALVKYSSEWEDLRLSMKETFAEGIAGGSKLGDILQDLLDQWKRSAILNVLLGAKSTTTGMRSGGLLDKLGGALGGAGGIFGAIGKLAGFAEGGSFKVGGAGGVDSQLVAFRASPDETVSITKPGQQGGGNTVNQVINMSIASNVDPAMAMRLKREMAETARSAAYQAINDTRRRSA